MRGFLKALVLVPIGIVVILFAVANRKLVQVSLDPISREAPQLAYEVPLFVLILASIAAGIVIGGVASWLVQGKHRRAERNLKRERERLLAEAEILRATAPQATLANLPARRA
jgi:uncharacterized integral membrane protein